MIHCPACEVAIPPDTVDCPRCGHRVGVAPPKANLLARVERGILTAAAVGCYALGVLALLFAVPGVIRGGLYNNAEPWQVLFWALGLFVLGAILRAVAGVWRCLEQLAKRP